MKIITYIASLVLSSFIYLLFSTYMSVSAGPSSILPIVSFYSAIIIFGLLSWLHLFKERLGAILLTIFTLVMFFTLPFPILIEYFNSEDYKPGIWEFLVPLSFSIIIIWTVWQKRKTELNKYIKIGLAIPTALLALYSGGYFTVRAFM